MNNKRIDTMHVHAARLISDNENKILKNGKIPSKYNSYIASFGPTVVQSTLLQTIALYSQEDVNNDRKLIINLIEAVLKEADFFNIKAKLADKSLHKYICEKIGNAGITVKNLYKELVLDAAVACKLAMKTFPEEDKEKNDD
ncbi:MAG: type III-B CRISPR module-associated protein Cmr5 [Desulfobacterales bacterium]|nr:type III-B CRISPR module-associated protein Cmr5 [Desulfobacterales bacterium]